MKKFLLLTSTMFFAIFVFGQKLPFQGKLMESGTPVNGTRSIEFALPGLSWSETHAGVQITDGLYFIVLGSITPLPANLFTGADELQLTLSVDGTALSPVTLYKPLAAGPDGLDLKGPGNGFIKGDFGTGSAVKENLPSLKLNGNLTTTFDRVSVNVSSNTDNTTEYGNVGVSSTNGFNSHFSPGYLGLNYINAPNVQFFSQNWSNKGHSGTLLLKGPNSTNFEIGSKHWENADLPWLNMLGTNPNNLEWGNGLLDLSGEKYNANSGEKERGILRIHDDEGYHAIMYSRQIMLLKPDWSPYASLNSHGDAGRLHLNGVSSEVTINNAANVQKAAFGMAGNDNLSARLRMAGPDAHIALEDELHSPNPPKVFIDIENSPNGNFGRLFLNGPNSSNVQLDIYDDPDHGIMRMNGKTNQERVKIFVKTDWDQQEKGTIELHGEDENKLGIIPTQFALHRSDWGTVAALRNSGNSAELELRGPNSRNFIIGSQTWGDKDIPDMRMYGKDDQSRMVLTTITDDGGERGILTLSNSNGVETTYANNGTWGNGPFNMWTGAQISGTLELNGDFIGTGNQMYSSDRRLKKDIQPLGENILNKIESLEGVSYYWRKDEFQKKNFSDDQQIGLIAQQLEAQFPALVKTNDDGFKSVNYNGFTAVLLQAVKELNAKVEKLGSENQKLQAELSASAYNRTEIDQLKSQMEMLTKLVTEKSAVSTETALTTGLK